MKTAFHRLWVWIPVLAAGLLLGGCATPPAAAGKQVELYRDGQTPAKSHQEIRVLTDEGSLGEQGEIEEKFIQQARRLQADALIIHPMVKIGGELKGFAIVETYLFKATAIVYTGP